MGLLYLLPEVAGATPEHRLLAQTLVLEAQEEAAEVVAVVEKITVEIQTAEMVALEEHMAEVVEAEKQPMLELAEKVALEEHMAEVAAAVILLQELEGLEDPKELMEAQEEGVLLALR